MESIDKSLNTLMQQIESIDGKHSSSATAYIPGMNGGNAYTDSGDNDISRMLRKYFLYWSLFLFVVVFILVIKPSNVYVYNPVSRQKYFSWSAFFMTVGLCYAFILSLYWIHTVYCTSS